ncbi:hypothetical protein DFJ64_0854 [Thermasporomyces composti]|uniref:Uncharacterized protein n=1 Tax=Thermasporomyces composti TaxID=696763 RepID=A0A3D9VBE2_THECX|nr:hypothetical protein DFJ64_0854 [Thermasporomyces composti]
MTQSLDQPDSPQRGVSAVRPSASDVSTLTTDRKTVRRPTISPTRGRHHRGKRSRHPPFQTTTQPTTTDSPQPHSRPPPPRKTLTTPSLPNHDSTNDNRLTSAPLEAATTAENAHDTLPSKPRLNQRQPTHLSPTRGRHHRGKRSRHPPFQTTTQPTTTDSPQPHSRPPPPRKTLTTPSLPNHDSTNDNRPISAPLEAATTAENAHDTLPSKPRLNQRQPTHLSPTRGRHHRGKRSRHPPFQTTTQPTTTDPSQPHSRPPPPRKTLTTPSLPNHDSTNDNRPISAPLEAATTAESAHVCLPSTATPLPEHANTRHRAGGTPARL